MTNTEKFKEVFGFYPDDSCPKEKLYKCNGDCDRCIWDKFWITDYKTFKALYEDCIE